MTFFAQNEVLEKQNGLFMGTFTAEMTLFSGEVIPQIIEIFGVTTYFSDLHVNSMAKVYLHNL